MGRKGMVENGGKKGRILRRFKDVDYFGMVELSRDFCGDVTGKMFLYLNKNYL